ncbi:serine hydrolase [Mesobacillus maritimus]|uniref:Serine hydrolase n=1 Tax=Mesobacillus maritimus TaxID=1643336 RepID=A0ABS7KBD7_9BACI|nr:serine hydrolase [Mesobacillus maritimus]MBY0099395.1 serine hydrolase [Mesobacillus maritimus]
MKKRLGIAASIIGGSFLLFGIGSWVLQKVANKEDPEYFLQFIKENGAKQSVAVSIQYNQDSLAAVNEQVSLPLASTMKIILAIEYARQAAEGMIDPQQPVSLDELETYYVPKTDGGAHEAWLESVKETKQDDAVPLSEVANGMIAYSSNANTEYLIEVLGEENINGNIIDLEINSHEPIYPLVSSLFIPIQVMNEENLTKQETVAKLKEMSLDEYREHAKRIHENWKTQPPTDEEKKNIINELDMEFQRIWSDRLPRGSAEDYLSIMEKLNRKEFFKPEVYQHLDPVMEQLMKNPQNQEWLTHAGQKGGSTAFVLTMAMYATDKNQNKTEFVFLADDLSSTQQTKLSRNMNQFQLKLLRDEDFREKVKQELENL